MGFLATLAFRFLARRFTHGTIDYHLTPVKHCGINLLMSQKTYTTREAAKLIGVSHQTLRDWVDAGEIVAPKQITVGKMAIRLWTKANIAKARKIRGTLKPGPRSKKKK